MINSKPEKQRIEKLIVIENFTALKYFKCALSALTLLVGWLVGWGLTALLTQNRSYRACRFVGIFYSKL